MFKIKKSIGTTKVENWKLQNYKIFRDRNWWKCTIVNIKFKKYPKRWFDKKNEITFKNLNLSKIELNKNEIKKLIIENPISLQRPLITKYIDGLLVKSVIGRPPEKVNTLFN